MRATLIDFAIRFRTWLIAALSMVALFLPELLLVANEILNAPEVLAVLPESWKGWVGAVGFICLVWSRWRPATRAADPEVQVQQFLKSTDDRVAISVVSKTDGMIKAAIDV